MSHRAELCAPVRYIFKAIEMMLHVNEGCGQGQFQQYAHNKSLPDNYLTMWH